MRRLIDLNTSDIKEYISLGLMDDTIDIDFWKRSNKESQEIVLPILGDINEIIKALYYSPHKLPIQDMPYIDNIKPHMIPMLYDVLESKKLRLRYVHEELDPTKLRCEYFYENIYYQSDLEHLLPIMIYTINYEDEIDEAIRLYKLGVRTIELGEHCNNELDIIKRLYNHGVIINSGVLQHICSMESSDILEYYNMGYKLLDSTCYDSNIDNIETYNICLPFLCSSSIIKICLRLKLPLPDIPTERYTLTFDSMHELEEYSKREDIKALNIDLRYNGEYILSPLLTQYNIKINNFNLANWIMEEYPNANIRINTHPNKEDLLPPEDGKYYINGAKSIISSIWDYPVILKYYIDNYGDKINIKLKSSNKFFVKC